MIIILRKGLYLSTYRWQDLRGGKIYYWDCNERFSGIPYDEGADRILNNIYRPDFDKFTP